MEAVFALGSNGSGQLGIGHTEDVSVPKQVCFLASNKDSNSSPSSSSSSSPNPSPETRIVKFAAGGNHTLLLAASAELYWAGDSSTGSCGLVSSTTPAESAFRPVRLFPDESGASKVGMVAATWEASIVTTTDEQGRNPRVYTLGCGTKGELGQGPFIVRLPSAQPIAAFPLAGTEVTDLAACMGHVVALLSNGDVYGWGNGRKGQLGAPAAVVNEPRRIEGVGFKVSKAVCGKDFTCLVGDPSSGKILVLGADKWGVKSSAPASVPGWRDVQASWGSIYVLRADGSLQGWGRGDHGQLPPVGLPRLSQIAVGSEHVVAVTEAQEVLSWGWGEHGNCGPQVDKNGDVSPGWNVIASSKYIPTGSRIAAIGAGCATSWIVIGQSPTSD